MRLANKTALNNSLFEKLLGIAMFVIGTIPFTLLFDNVSFSYIFASAMFFLAGGILEWQAHQSSRDEHADDMGMISPRAKF